MNKKAKNKLPKLNTEFWYAERVVFFIAGSFVLASIILAIKVNINFLWFTALVALMLIFFAVTGICPMYIVLNKVGIKSRCGR